RLRGAPLDAVATARVAHRGDAVRQPQLVDVFGGHALLVAADVAVHVDEAWQHVVAAQVDLVAARHQRRPRLRVDRRVGGADDLHPGDAVAFDDDVHRAVGRRAGAVDHGHSAQDQLRPGTVALVALGRGGNGRGG